MCTLHINYIQSYKSKIIVKNKGINKIKEGLYATINRYEVVDQIIVQIN